MAALRLIALLSGVGVVAAAPAKGPRALVPEDGLTGVSGAVEELEQAIGRVRALLDVPAARTLERAAPKIIDQDCTVFTGKVDDATKQAVEQALATATGEQTAAATAEQTATAALAEAQAMRASTAAEAEKEAKAQDLAAKMTALGLAEAALDEAKAQLAAKQEELETADKDDTEEADAAAIEAIGALTSQIAGHEASVVTATAEMEAAYTAAEEAEHNAEEAAAEDERLVEEATKANAEASAAKPAADAKVATLTAESTWWTAMATKFTPWEAKHGDTCSAFDVVVNVGGVASRACRKLYYCDGTTAKKCDNHGRGKDDAPASCSDTPSHSSAQSCPNELSKKDGKVLAFAARMAPVIDYPANLNACMQGLLETQKEKNIVKLRETTTKPVAEVACTRDTCFTQVRHLNSMANYLEGFKHKGLGGADARGQLRMWDSDLAWTAWHQAAMIFPGAVAPDTRELFAISSMLVRTWQTAYLYAMWNDVTLKLIVAPHHNELPKCGGRSGVPPFRWAPWDGQNNPPLGADWSNCPSNTFEKARAKFLAWIQFYKGVQDGDCGWLPNHICQPIKTLLQGKAFPAVHVGLLGGATAYPVYGYTGVIGPQPPAADPSFLGPRDASANNEAAQWLAMMQKPTDGRVFRAIVRASPARTAFGHGTSILGEGSTIGSAHGLYLGNGGQALVKFADGSPARAVERFGFGKPDTGSDGLVDAWAVTCGFPPLTDCSSAWNMVPPYCDNMFNPYGTFVVGRPLSYLNGPHAYCAVKANMGGAAEVAADPML